MTPRVLRAGLLFALVGGLGTGLWAQQHRIDDPVPAGAKGAVLTISGQVLPIVGVSSPVVGLASQVAGRVDPLAAALKDLGAKTTDTEIRIEMSADVLFDFDKADVKREAEPALGKVATVLASYPRSAVTVEGHTDGKGSDAYNQKLSERRATAVARWLTASGKVKGAKLTARGFGSKKPVAPNAKPDGSDDPEGRQKNRRVEIVVKK